MLDILGKGIPDMRQPQPLSVQIRDSLKQIVKAIYFIHLFVIFVYSIILIALQPKLRVQFTFSLALIIIYGFLLLWTVLFILICVLLGNKKIAEKCSRWGVKIITVLFILLCPIALLQDSFMLKRSVVTFMLYQLLFSIFMVIYMIYDCTCGHHDYMKDILQKPNQLGHIQKQVQQSKKQREKMKKAISAPV